MICASLLIGEASALNMSPRAYRAWQKEKIMALEAALNRAAQLGAKSCCVAGGLFADGFIPQSLVQEALDVLNACGMPVAYAPGAREALGLGDYIGVSTNITLLRDEAITWENLHVVRDDEGVQIAFDTPDGPALVRIPALEPASFENTELTGFLLVDIQDGLVVGRSVVECALHPFVTRVVSVEGLQASGDVIHAIGETVSQVPRESFLRLVLRGSMPVGAVLNTNKLECILDEKFFYAEVANECRVAVGNGDLAGDISLMAEFARLVEADDTLSPVEKSRVVACGWNALNGKELAE